LACPGGIAERASAWNASSLGRTPRQNAYAAGGEVLAEQGGAVGVEVDDRAADQPEGRELVPSKEPPRPLQGARRLLTPPQQPVGGVPVVGDVAARPNPLLA
jgi:hypothetical protein